MAFGWPVTLISTAPQKQVPTYGLLIMSSICGDYGAQCRLMPPEVNEKTSAGALV